MGTPCGDLPSDWNAARHGRHYCLAAPETSTSEAAAYISGTLARLMANARGQVGSLELVRRIMNTADQSGRYSDSVIYGAGLVDSGAAQQAIGSASTGLEGADAPVQQTTLRLPSAYGDAHRRFADVEIAAFDDWNYPFWIQADELVEVGQTDFDPIPAFREDEAGELCSDVRLHASGYNCFAISDRMAGLASNHGVGTSIRIGNHVSVSTLTQSERRLDGAASGGLLLGERSDARHGSPARRNPHRRELERGVAREPWSRPAQGVWAPQILDVRSGKRPRFLLDVRCRPRTGEGTHQRHAFATAPGRARHRAAHLSGRTNARRPSASTRPGASRSSRAGAR